MHRGRMRGLAWRVVVPVVVCALIVPAASVAATTLPPVKHVFVLIDENESASSTFGTPANDPYLATTLPSQGAYLPNYYGIGHNSLDNYIAMVSGQAPNPLTSGDCQIFANFPADSMDSTGQENGEGCVYPADVPTLMAQLDGAGLTWRSYDDSMGADPSRESATCGHPPVGAADNTESETALDQYATRHDPFVYFHYVIDNTAECNADVVGFDGDGPVGSSRLSEDLQSVASTPNYVFITPSLCNDGHDATCLNGQPGGLGAADAFLQKWVPVILSSPAYQQNGLLIITFDEAEDDDSTACCGEVPGPFDLAGGILPGGTGPGGGVVGAVLLSPYIKAGTVSSTPYNHYAMLAGVEDLFGLPRIGDAAGVTSFGSDVFTNWSVTSTTVSCAPAAVATGSAATCTATVSDPSTSGASAPSGTVSFTASPTTGAFGTTGTCTLSGRGTSASCGLPFTPSAGAGYTISASYAGDGTHAASQGSGSLTANALPAIPVTGRVSVNGRAKVSKGGVIDVELSCAGGSGSTCAGTVTLTSTVKVKTKHRVDGRVKQVTRIKRVGLGSARYTVAAGDTATVRVAVSKAGAGLVRHAASHAVKATAVTKPSAGTTTTRTVELS